MIELAQVFGIIGLGCALIVYLRILKHPVDTERMHEIAEAMHEGAMAQARICCSRYFCFTRNGCPPLLKIW